MLRSFSAIGNSLGNFWHKLSKKELQLRPMNDYDTKRIDRRYTSSQIKNLGEIVKYNYDEMSILRDSSKAMREQYASHLFTKDVKNKVFINKMQDAVRIWTQNLITGDPRLSIETEHPELRNQGWALQHAVNMHLAECRIGEEFAQGVFNSFFGPGIFKTGLGAGAPLVFAEDGEGIDPGMAFTESIAFDDFVVDMAAKSPSKADVIGNRFLRPRAWVKEQVRKAASGAPFSGIDDKKESDMLGSDLISGHRNDGDTRAYDMVYVWDWYLPKENMVITIPDGGQDPIALWEWDGPEGGLYDVLNLYPFSESPISPSPCMSLYELHMSINKLMRKTVRQTDRAKNVLVGEQSTKKAAETIADSNDGEIALVQPGMLEKMKSMNYGGADPAGGLMLNFILQTFDTEGGNLTSLGGLGPSAETFRGDKMINESASSLIKFFQTRLSDTASAVLGKHLWWVWTENIRDYDGSAEIPGTDIRVPWSFTAGEREGNFIDYNYKIAPYSMQNRTPDENTQKLMEIWNGFIMPSAEILMQSGMMPNAAGVAQYICKQQNIPVDIVLQAMDPKMRQESAQKMVQAPARLGGDSNTTNTRVSVPGVTPQGEANKFSDGMSQLAASGQGGSEA